MRAYIAFERPTENESEEERERERESAKANNLCITLDIAMILAFVFCTRVLVM